tara:strand:+ start:10927 stop:12186 length:1260 start_codon:yes stop_codon:yes gene_type:complete
MAALLSVAMAFFSILIFDGYIKNVTGLYANVHRYRLMYGDLIIQNPKLKQKEGKAEPIAYSLTQEQQYKIETYLSSRPTDVLAYVKNLDFSGTISNGRISTIFTARAFDQPGGLKLRGTDWAWNALYGEPLHVGEPGQKILLGQSLARTLGCKAKVKQNAVNVAGGFKEGNREFNCDTNDFQLTTTTASGQVNSLSMIVSGLTDAGIRNIDARYVLADLKDAQILVNTDRIGYYTVLLFDSAAIDKFIDEFNTNLNDPNIQILRWQKHPVGDSYNRTINLLKIFRNFLIFVLVCVSGFSISMTFSKNVKERTKEIGLLKSLGFVPEKILTIFLFESAILCAFGVLTGLVMGYLFLGVVNSIQFYYKAGMISEKVVLQINPNVTSLLFLALMLIVLGLIASYFSAKGTIKKSAVDCLTHS